jgi:hypothetical protein
MRKDSFWFGMLRKREVVVPSPRGMLILALAAAAAGWILITRLQLFLAVNRPIGGEVLVVEGWIPDYAMREALLAFRSRPYKMIVTTGGPLPQGMAYSYYGTHAQLAAAFFRESGLSADSLTAVPSPEAGRDRTYQEGVSLREWMRSTGRNFASLDLVSFSTHARRSRLLYRMALGKGTGVGVYALRDAGYNPAIWWKTSNGFRRVSDEAVAYLYAKLWFRP